MRCRLIVIASLVVVLGLIGSPSAVAEEDRCDYVVCQATEDGLAVEATRLLAVKQQARGAKALAAEYVAALRRPSSESTITPGCPGNDPNRGQRSYDYACAYLTMFCRNTGQPGGTLTWVWRRPLGGDTTPTGPWRRVAWSCNVPGAVVDAIAGPGLTRPIIERAFRQLRFAGPTVRVQPEGNVTLVNLETFYQVTWPTAGYEPGEIATLTLLGRQVRIKPTARSFTYTFGDGERRGPTPDAGGTYPDGGIRHVYLDQGRVSVSVQARYSGQYSIDGNPWNDLDIEVPVNGTPTTVQVKQARARLVANPD